MGYVEIGLRALFVTVFVASFASKAGGFDAFVGSVRGMIPVAGPRVRPIAWGVLAFEAAVCLSLALPGRSTAVAGFLLASALLVAFILGIAAALHRGTRVPCRCFGDSSTPVSRTHLVRNLVLLALALVGAAAAAPGQQLPVPSVLLCAAAGVLLGAIVIELDAIVRLFRPVHVPSKT